MSGSSSAVDITKADEASRIANSYIVRLKETGDITSHLGWMKAQETRYKDDTSSKCEVVHKYE
ncbi:hypothetical protein FRC07_008526, partial [Ceratobasidium sp. 392]